jgi:acid phosphatase
VSTGGHKVIVIPEENHSSSEFFSSLPYLASLASTYGQATSYHAIGHPSLPNYLAIFGGSTYGTSSDCGIGCGPGSSGQSVWDQTLAAGKSAKAYQDGMTSNCASGGGTAYAPRHGPWPYWTGTTPHANCLAHDVPLSALQPDISAGTLPVTGEITPNLNNDWHDGSAAQADAFLQNWVPKLQAGSDYTSGNLTIIIVADEDDGSQGNLVPFVVVNKALSHKSVSLAANHYSLTRWLEENAGVALQNNATTASDLKVAFGL